MDKYFHPLFGIGDPDAESDIRREFHSRLTRGRRAVVGAMICGLLVAATGFMSRQLKFPDSYRYVLIFVASYIALAAVSVLFRSSDRRVLREVLRRARRCTNCGYDLSAGPVETCPECGAAAEASGPDPDARIRISLRDDGGKAFIHIETADIALLKTLQRVFFDLTQSRIARQSLSALNCVEWSGLHDFVLVNSPSKLSPFRLGHVEIDPTRSGVYVWTESADTWFDCVSKIQTLIEEQSPGRQYLLDDSEPISDVLLAFRERSD